MMISHVGPIPLCHPLGPLLYRARAKQEGVWHLLPQLDRRAGEGKRQAAQLQAWQEQLVWRAGHRLWVHDQPGASRHLVPLGWADFSRYCKFVSMKCFSKAWLILIPVLWTFHTIHIIIYELCDILIRWTSPASGWWCQPRRPWSRSSSWSSPSSMSSRSPWSGPLAPARPSSPAASLPASPPRNSSTTLSTFLPGPTSTTHRMWSCPSLIAGGRVFMVPRWERNA